MLDFIKNNPQAFQGVISLIVTGAVSLVVGLFAKNVKSQNVVDIVTSAVKGAHDVLSVVAPITATPWDDHVLKVVEQAMNELKARKIKVTPEVTQQAVSVAVSLAAAKASAQPMSDADRAKLAAAVADINSRMPALANIALSKQKAIKKAGQ